jgi:putative hydrolase of the HAD superfamily
VIRALISDFGGVLTTPLTESFGALRKEAGVSLVELGMAMQRAGEKYGEHPLFALERGEIAETEFSRRLQEQLGESFDFMRLRHHLGTIDRNPPMIDYVRELRGRGLRTALLTNNVREWEPLWRGKLPEVDELFEVVIDSSFVGMRKPERRIYELTLERLGDGLGAEECVFLDDLDINCEAARALGMTAVRFHDSEQAIAELEEAFAPTFSRNVRGDLPFSP